jgi:hypothetical protein
MYCGGSHLGFAIGIKNIKFVENLPMIIPGQLGFNCSSGFRDVHWMVLYKLHVFCSDMKFKMAATAGPSLTLDPMGEMFQKASSLKPTRSCSGSHLGITINIKNTKFVKDLPMIDAQFRFNRCNSFREEYIWSSTNFTFFVPI